MVQPSPKDKCMYNTNTECEILELKDDKQHTQYKQNFFIKIIFTRFLFQCRNKSSLKTQYSSILPTLTTCHFSFCCGFAHIHARIK